MDKATSLSDLKPQVNEKKREGGREVGRGGGERERERESERERELWSQTPLHSHRWMVKAPHWVELA